MQKLKPMLAVLLALVVALPSTASAQKQADKDADEIAAYRLTMAAAKKFEAVSQAMAEIAAKDPKLQAQMRLEREIETLQKKEELTDAEAARLEKLQQQLEEMENEGDDEDASSDYEDLDAMAKEIEQIPGAAAAFRRAGMTAREYFKFSLALMQASMYVGLKQAGTIKEYPANANHANVKFVETHMEELKAIQGRIERLNKGAP